MNAPTTPRHETAMQRGSTVAVLAVCLGLALIIIVLSFKVHNLNTQVAQAAQTQKQVEPAAKPENTAAQADLDRAKASLAQLQAQLDTAAGQKADLQSKLDKAKAQSADLQSQLDKAKAGSADLQSQLEKSKAESADLQSQLGASKAQSADLQSQLGAAKAQSADLQSSLQKAESEIAGLQPLVHRARHMPVATSVEKAQGSLFSWAGSGGSLTLHINNLFLDPLTVDIKISGPATTRELSTTLPGGAAVNVEKLTAGDKVVISSESYDPVTVTVQ